jgi:hypothetical protein
MKEKNITLQEFIGAQRFRQEVLIKKNDTARKLNH